MQSWNVNPATGDYVLDSGGNPQQTNSLQVPAYFRLKTKRTKWLYAPDTNYGSDYYTTTRRPTENGNQQLENIGTAALQPMVDDGRALQVEVDVTAVGQNSSQLQITIVDASGGVEQQTFPGLGV